MEMSCLQQTLPALEGKQLASILYLYDLLFPVSMDTGHLQFFIITGKVGHHFVTSNVLFVIESRIRMWPKTAHHARYSEMVVYCAFKRNSIFHKL